MATKIITYPSKSVGDTWFATEANSLKDVINSNVSAFLDHAGSAEIHRAIDDSATGATDLWSAEKIYGELTAKAAEGHTHDDRYYTESEVDALVSGAGKDEFGDDVFRIQDDGDATKEISFQASAISTGTTRTITMPDQDIDLTPGEDFAAASGINGVTVDGSGNIKLGGNLTETTQIGATGDPYTLSMAANVNFINSGFFGYVRSAGSLFLEGVTIRIQGSSSGQDIYIGDTGGQQVYLFPQNFTGSASGYLVRLKNNATGEIEYAAPEFATDIFAIVDSADNTKKIDVDASAISTGTTRTITMPDQDVDLTPGGTFAAASAAGSNEFGDDVFRIQDDGDATKEISFQASAISTGTTRTIIMPDEDVDLGDLNNIGDMAIFEAHKNGTQSVSSAWADVTGWTQGADTNTGVFSFNISTGELEVLESGNFLFSIDIDYQSTATDRSEGWAGLSIDTGGGHSLDTKYTFSAYTGRTTANVDEGGRGSVIILNATAGDKFKIQAKSEVNDSDIESDRARFYAVWLKGPKGDTGSTGPAGGNEKEDNVFRIIDDGDNTKKIAFDAGSITTGTVRTITMPDEDITLGTVSPKVATFVDSTGGASLSGVINLDSTLTNSATGVFSLASDEVTISEAGYYTVSYSLTCSTGSASHFSVSIELDTGGGFSTITESTRSDSVNGFNTGSASGTFSYNFSAGDKIRMAGSTFGSFSTVVNGSSLTIQKV